MAQLSNKTCGYYSTCGRHDSDWVLVMELRLSSVNSLTLSLQLNERESYLAKLLWAAHCKHTHECVCIICIYIQLYVSVCACAHTHTLKQWTSAFLATNISWGFKAYLRFQVNNLKRKNVPGEKSFSSTNLELGRPSELSWGKNRLLRQKHTLA